MDTIKNFILLPGLIISKDRDIDKDVEHKIKGRWLKWRYTSEVLCDQWMPTRLKEKFYKTVIRPGMTYAVEC